MTRNRSRKKTMIKRQFLAVALAAAALTIDPAYAWRGGGFGGFHAGGFGGGGFHGGGFDGGGFHGGGVEGGDWHAGGVGGYGGTWHADGYHAGGAWGGGYGYHGPAVVNSYYRGGCYACGAAAVGGLAALAIGASLATLPPACNYQVVGGSAYYNCGGQWLQPQYGYGGVHYVVVPPL
jgi:hypothetical protein